MWNVLVWNPQRANKDSGRQCKTARELNPQPLCSETQQKWLQQKPRNALQGGFTPLDVPMCFCLCKNDVKVAPWSSHSWLVAQNKRWLSCLFTLDPVEARRDVYRKCSTLGIVQRPAARGGRLHRFPVTSAWWKVSFFLFSSSDATSQNDLKASSFFFCSLKPFFLRPSLQVRLACARFSPSFVTLAAATSQQGGGLHVYVPFVTV